MKYIKGLRQFLQGYGIHVDLDVEAYEVDTWLKDNYPDSGSEQSDYYKLHIPKYVFGFSVLLHGKHA